VLVLGLVSVGNAYDFHATLYPDQEAVNSGSVSAQDYPGTVYQLIDGTNAIFDEEGARADNRFIINIVGGSTFEDHIWLEDSYHVVDRYSSYPSKVQYSTYLNRLTRAPGGSGTVYLEISW